MLAMLMTCAGQISFYCYRVAGAYWLVQEQLSDVERRGLGFDDRAQRGLLAFLGEYREGGRRTL